MGLMDSVTTDGLKAYQEPIVDGGTVTEFVIMSVNESDTGDILINTKIKAPEDYKGREKVHYFKNITDEESKSFVPNKRKWVDFAGGVWTEEEIKHGVEIGSLVGRVVTGKAKKPREHEGKTYQEFAGWKLIGTGIDTSDIPF